ncbi:unnamed protein product, partial [Allacma fusca]
GKNKPIFKILGFCAYTGGLNPLVQPKSNKFCD